MHSLCLSLWKSVAARLSRHLQTCHAASQTQHAMPLPAQGEELATINIDNPEFEGLLVEEEPVPDDEEEEEDQPQEQQQEDAPAVTAERSATATAAADAGEEPAAGAEGSTAGAAEDDDDDGFVKVCVWFVQVICRHRSAVPCLHAQLCAGLTAFPVRHREQTDIANNAAGGVRRHRPAQLFTFSA